MYKQLCRYMYNIVDTGNFGISLLSLVASIRNRVPTPQVRHNLRVENWELRNFKIGNWGGGEGGSSFSFEHFAGEMLIFLLDFLYVKKNMEHDLCSSCEICKSCTTRQTLFRVIKYEQCKWGYILFEILNPFVFFTFNYSHNLYLVETSF